MVEFITAHGNPFSQKPLKDLRRDRSERNWADSFSPIPFPCLILPSSTYSLLYHIFALLSLLLFFFYPFPSSLFPSTAINYPLLPYYFLLSFPSPSPLLSILHLPYPLLSTPLLFVSSCSLILSLPPLLDEWRSLSLPSYIRGRAPLSILDERESASSRVGE